MVAKLIAKEPVVDHVRAIPKNAFSREGNWTPEQLKLAFHFYCQTPFGKLDARNKKVIELANLIGRTPGALAMKLVNFASLDPAIVASGRAGLSNASRLDREIWDEFHADWERLALECEQIRHDLLSAHIGDEAAAGDVEVQPGIDDFTGETRQAIVQQRIKQRFFRRAVLSSYRSRCCISRVSDTRLLVASHIVPWRTDAANRLNPSNGLCLSAIHDRAFDEGLFTLSEDWRIVLSKSLRITKDDFLKEVFFPVEGKQIELPERFTTSQIFLEHHRTVLFADAIVR
jgi:putative restriction endonuclease